MPFAGRPGTYTRTLTDTALASAADAGLAAFGQELLALTPGELEEFCLANPDLIDVVEAALAEEDLERFIAGRALAEVRSEAEQSGTHWMRVLFPSYARFGFAPHMAQLWEWVWAIRRGVRPPPMVAVWFRGAAKSTTAEAALAALGARGVRRYALYVCNTQDQADEHVGTLGEMLASPRFAALYPEMASRAVTQYGSSRGWSRKRLHTASGFVVDALGLEKNVRGLRVDEDRPDIICHEKGTVIRHEDGTWRPVEEHPTAKAKHGDGKTVTVWGLPFSETVTAEHRYWARAVRWRRGRGRRAKNIVDWGEPGWVEASELGPHHYLGFPIDDSVRGPDACRVYKPGQRTVRCETTGRVVSSGNGWAEEIPPEFADPEWWWAIGLWWGDGHVAGPHQVAWTIGDSTPDVRDRLTALIERSGRHWSAVDRPGCTQIVMSRSVLNRWLRTWRSGGNSRKVPPLWVEQLDLPFQRSLLAGYLDADGHYSPSGEIKLTSIHLPGLLSARRMLARLGIAATIRRGPRGRVEYFPNRLLPSVGQDKYDLRFQFGAEQFGHPQPAASRYRFGRTFIRDGWLWSKVRSVDDVTDRVFVPITTVTHDYLTAFGRSHNCLDDVDADTDGPAAVKKKIDLITRKILPTGAADLAVLAVQNLVHPDSIFARLAGRAEERADFLVDRIVVGPVPAIEGLEVDVEPETGRHVVVGGAPTWVGYDLKRAQDAIDTFGYSSFLAEGQHVVKAASGGMFDRVRFVRCDPPEVPPLSMRTCWVDPAVEGGEQNDSQAIQIDGLAVSGVIYRLWSWEGKIGPQEAIEIALRHAIRFGCSTLGIETDQGGKTWTSVYKEACRTIRDRYCGTCWARFGQPEDDEVVARALRDQHCRDENHAVFAGPFPGYRSEKAGSGLGPKAHRASQMLADYEIGGRIVHVRGTHVVLEAALTRFPKVKPFDLTDASFYSWRACSIRRSGMSTGRSGRTAARTQMPSVLG